jgi:hypothetical protein
MFPVPAQPGGTRQMRLASSHVGTGGLRCSRKVGRGLLRAGVRLLVAGVLLVATTAAGLAHTSAATTHRATTHRWIVTGWNIHLLYDRNAGLARHFFNTPKSYGTGIERTANPVIDGMAATPVLWYTSYQKFASDVQSGAITYPYKWVFYDPEGWTHTPLAERQDPGTYMRMFAQLAHAHGLKVIESPARNLGLTAGSFCPKQQGETLDSWYLRCNIAGLAAAYGDAVVIQDQANQKDLAVYQSFFNTAKQQALAANPSIPLFPVLSTNRGSPATMIAAAKSVTTTGYYVTIRHHRISEAAEFFNAMKAAKY